MTAGTGGGLPWPFGSAGSGPNAPAGRSRRGVHYAGKTGTTLPVPTVTPREGRDRRSVCRVYRSARHVPTVTPREGRDRRHAAKGGRRPARLDRGKTAARFVALSTSGGLTDQAGNRFQDCRRRCRRARGTQLLSAGASGRDLGPDVDRVGNVILSRPWHGEKRIETGRSVGDANRSAVGTDPTRDLRPRRQTKPVALGRFAGTTAGHHHAMRKKRTALLSAWTCADVDAGWRRAIDGARPVVDECALVFR